MSVQKVSSVDVSTLVLNAPEQTSAKTRFSSIVFPLLQTSELTYRHEQDTMEVLCSSEHADQMSAIDDAICTLISEKSNEWFGQTINYDQIEKMFRPTLQGSKNPRQIFTADNFKVFDSNNKPTDSFMVSGRGVFIVRLDGVRFEEKVCEAVWSVVQAKELEDSKPVQPDPGPLFLS